MNLTEVEVGSAVQYKGKEWCLVTSENTQENVVPMDLVNCLLNLVNQIPGDNRVELSGHDWYRGQFHFKHWYRLLSILLPDASQDH